MSAAVAAIAFSAGFILYVLLVYPALIAAWARVFPKPVLKQFVPKRVSVIIAVRNGAQWVERKIESLLASDYPGYLLEILFVSDGSTDNTEGILHACTDPRIRYLALPAGGKAVALTRGMDTISGEIVVFTDVRQEFDVKALHHLVSCFADPTVGVVTGELHIREGRSSEESNTGLYWRYEKAIRRNLSRIDAMLGATGSIYAIRRELAAPIPADILLDDVYLPFKVSFKGFRIYFEEQAKAYDDPTALRSEFWRKVRTQAGVYQTLAHFPALLWPGNRKFLHFLSHKIGRLLLPFALIAIAVSSFALPHSWRGIALVLQVVFYGLAAIDPLVPEHSSLKRISSLVRTFVVLLAAALAGIVVFFVPAQRLWRETRGATTPPAITHTEPRS
ncbi:MAG TPA: glycosyltransferase [Bryobacteraceae bacterium]|jgi:cellulose synthase/poly-beta-1,6-N-acetylglucosamine synthase-like glycosyltransferase